MALKVVISHKTTYKFDRPVSLSPHVFRLRPAPHSRTPIEAYSIKIKPEDNFFNWQQDPFGNYQARLIFHEKTTQLSIDVEIIADMSPINPFDFFMADEYKEYPFEYDKKLKQELLPYIEINEDGDRLKDFVKTIDLSKQNTIDFLVYLNQFVSKHLSYTIRLEPGVQSCEETLKLKTGSCRDFAWLMVQVFRHIGIAARFVSGYLVQLTADEKSLDGPSGPESDFTDLHAWTEVYVPGAGWVGLDATSGLLVGEGHIPLSCTPHYESAAPVTGFVDECETAFEFHNEVKRIFESPRVTKPYTDEAWDKIYNLGFKVDEDLVKNDVRLTMGGEPTFISIDDQESPEWNTEADGKHKRKLANELSKRLMDKFAPGAMMHHAQGKWYPGEQLPRWQKGIIWRKDGIPVWNNPKLAGDTEADYGYTEKDAKVFLETLCRYLLISEQNILPAYEDIVYFLWEEGNLPVDVDPMDHDVDDVSVRQKLRDLLQGGMKKPQGFVLPLGWGTSKWITCKWEFRRKSMFLIPGNSPVGLRLPLDSLKYAPHKEIDEDFEPDLFSAVPTLDTYYDKVKERGKKYTKKLRDNTTYFEYVRTAICTEARDGKVYIFLPPLKSAESFLDLVSSIEAAAAELNMPILIEGYEPPTDLRLEKLKVTPDPGVIEVNIHPTNNWKDLAHNTITLYEEARLSRLGTEKFMLDGKHTGTGGGNHVTIGGITPSDSPMLRNPTLLRSLLTFWQHHPGLSYLFSGAFIGPTSQAPRIDEARLENLYELEIAFSQIPEGEEVPYWLSDRLFRNLLTDITGNTHRAEFCIDKMYSPDSASGRLGILELRAFDMPPHARMSLTQMLLVRALISVFWKKPYKHKLVRWGTKLHDNFLLEHFVKKDLQDVVEMLNNEGYPFELSWFDPFFEFRFPLYGLTKIKDFEVEVRSAIEPWNVLGEEVSAHGTSRYVDSSLERVQIKVKGFVNERYVVTCNGVKVPLTATDIAGEFVAGIRYKAWQPHSALHATIGTDTPLVFDIVDTWNRRSVGGCTYFIAHPGGRGYDVFPVNSFEAESRRSNRFWNFGHTPGTIASDNNVQPRKYDVKENPVEETDATGPTIFNYKELPENEEFPNTLDLRLAKAKN